MRWGWVALFALPEEFLCAQQYLSLLSSTLGYKLIPLETKEKTWHRIFRVFHPQPLQMPLYLVDTFR